MPSSFARDSISSRMWSGTVALIWGFRSTVEATHKKTSYALDFWASYASNRVQMKPTIEQLLFWLCLVQTAFLALKIRSIIKARASRNWAERAKQS
jgi:hypothetical protein